VGADLRARHARHRLVAVVLLGSGLHGCRPERAPVETPAPTSDHASPSSARGPTALAAFSWDGVLVVAGTTLGGPGLASVAKIGRRVAVLGGDGETWTATIDTVDDEACEGEAREGCRFVSIAYDRGDDASPSRVPWNHVKAPDTEHPPEDIALLDVHLAVAEGTELPALVPHVLEVRYANALCESGADDEDYVRVKAYTSAGPDPIAGATALEGKTRFPRRVVTLRTRGRTLHFVTVAEVEPPASGRMSDIAKARQTSLFVLEGDGPGARVLHRESHAGSRSMNVDTSCQLPLRYPTPWGVVEVGGSVYVLMQSGLTKFERWSLQPAGIVREGGFTAHVHEIG
jgi:hypothetical protein